VLVDAKSRLWLLDWDEVMLAPRERDLMFATEGGISRDLVDAVAERNFMAGYGSVDPDRLALSYYRHAWAVQDIADFGTAAANGHKDAARMLDGLFEPGQIIVDLAHRSR
jgi:spectinomycin phosphotransferase